MRLFPLLSAVVVPVALLANCQSDATAPIIGPAEDFSPISVIPKLATIDGGKVLKLVARVRNADGSFSEPTDVTWASADGTIAQVDTKGLVQGLRAGRTQIVATWRTSRGSSLVTVLDPVGKKKEPPPCQALQNSDGSTPTGGLCLH